MSSADLSATERKVLVAFIALTDEKLAADAKRYAEIELVLTPTTSFVTAVDVAERAGVKFDLVVTALQKLSTDRGPLTRVPTYFVWDSELDRARRLLDPVEGGGLDG